MKKNDFILIAAILFVVFLAFSFQFLRKPQNPAVVVVTVSGKEYGTFDLNKEQEIDICGSNTLLIKDGAASMTKANCPDKVCTYHKAISKNGESIICLPNRIMVTVKSNDQPFTDAVAN